MHFPRRFIRSISILLLMLAMLPLLLHAQDAGQRVIKRGHVDDDLYLAAAQVDLYATVDGDVVVAGGQLHLEGDIRADVIAAGGIISLRGSVADDARLAGGELRLSAQIGDDLVAAGGRIHISPAASIAGRAWLSGGDIRIDGNIKQQLRAAGGRVVIAGTVNGDVELWADQVVIEQSAVINGNLHYTSAHPASIAGGARIAGEVVQAAVEIPMQPVIAGIAFALLLWLLSMIVTAVLLYLLFPDFSLRLCEAIEKESWPSLGVGLAVFAATPVLILILFATTVGIWLGLMLLAIYLFVLMAGYFAGALFVGNAGLKLVYKGDVGKAARAAALSVAIVALAILNLVPLLGMLIVLLVLLAGMGALSRQLYRMYSA